MTGKQTPPSNLDMERAILGSMLLANETIAVARESLAKSDFYNAAHQIIYEAMIELDEAGKGVDLITLVGLLKDKQQLDAIGGPGYLASLDQFVLTPGNIRQYMEKIKKDSLARRLIAQTMEFVEKLYATVDLNQDIIEYREALDKTVSTHKLDSERWVCLGDPELIDEAMQYIINIRKRDNDSVECFLRHLNMYNNGYPKGEISLLVGAPGIGKTLWMSQQAIYSAERKQTVALFSMQVQKYRFLTRIAKQMSGFRDAEYGRDLDISEQVKIGEWGKRAAMHLPYVHFFYDSFLTPAKINNELAALVTEGKVPDIVILDLFHSLKPTHRKTGQVQEQEEMSTDLMAIAGKYNIAFLVLGHPRKDHFHITMLDMDSCRGAGAIAGDAKTMIAISQYSQKQIEEIKDEDIKNGHEPPPDLRDERDKYIRCAIVKANEGQTKAKPVIYLYSYRKILDGEAYRDYHKFENSDQAEYKSRDIPNWQE